MINLTKHLLAYDEMTSEKLFIPYICNMKNYISDSFKNIATIFWILIAVILWYQVHSHVILEEAILITAFMLFTMFLINMYISACLLPKAIREKKMNTFWVQFILSIFLQASVIAGLLLVFKRLEELTFFPSSSLFSKEDSFLSNFKNQIPASIIINLAFVGLRFYHEHIKLEKAHLEFQLHSLQTQINPHFMFNVLNHIHYFVKQKDDMASVLLLNYSDILRYQLYSSKKETVSIEEEVQFLKKFVEIERIRWEDKININCIWEIENSGKEISPLLLIPLIENAFKHVSRCSDRKSYINIIFKQKADMINLEVENSKLINPIQKKTDSGLGLENLKNRLEIIYYSKYSLSVNETDTFYNSKLSIQI